MNEETPFDVWWNQEGEHLSKRGSKTVASIAWKNGEYTERYINGSYRVTSVEDLLALSRRRMSVIVPRSRIWNNPKPAAFLINTSGTTLARLFATGMFVYKPKENK